MKDEELKEILKDPKKLLDLFRVFHRLLHLYEAQELMKEKIQQKKSNETVGLSDSVEIKVTKADSNSNKSEEAKQ